MLGFVAAVIATESPSQDRPAESHIRPGRAVF